MKASSDDGPSYGVFPDVDEDNGCRISRADGYVHPIKRSQRRRELLPDRVSKNEFPRRPRKVETVVPLIDHEEWERGRVRDNREAGEEKRDNQDSSVPTDWVHSYLTNARYRTPRS